MQFASGRRGLGAIRRRVKVEGAPSEERPTPVFSPLAGLGDAAGRLGNAQPLSAPPWYRRPLVEREKARVSPRDQILLSWCATEGQPAA